MGLWQKLRHSNFFSPHLATEERLFQRVRASLRHHVPLLQGNSCFRCSALLFLLARADVPFEGTWLCTLFLAVRCAPFTAVLRIVGINYKKMSSSPGKWKELTGGSNGRD